MLANQKKIGLIQRLIAIEVLKLSADNTSVGKIHLWKLLQHPQLLTSITQEVACKLYALKYKYLAASSCSTLPLLVSTGLSMSQPSVFVPTEWSFLFALLNSMGQYDNGDTLVLIEPAANSLELAERISYTRLNGAHVTDVVALFELPTFKSKALLDIGVTLQSVFTWKDIHDATSA